MRARLSTVWYAKKAYSCNLFSRSNLLYLLHLPLEIGFAAGPFEFVLPLLSEELLHDRPMLLPLLMIPDALCIHPRQGFPHARRHACTT